MYKHSGGCLSGRVRFKLKEYPEVAYACHCRFWHRATGTAFRSGLRSKKSSVKFNNAVLNSYVYKSPEHGRKLTFYFCPICATTVTTTLERFSDIQIILLGTLDNPSEIEIKTHMFVEEGMHWVGFNNDDTTYSKHRINADGSTAIPIDIAPPQQHQNK